MLLSKFVQNIEFGKAHFLERVIGIEPTSSAWRADALTVVLYPLIFLSLLTESNCHLGVTNAL